jgi:deoxycytidylate deaminase
MENESITNQKIISIDKFSNVLPILKKIALNSALSNKHAACLFRGGEMMSFGVNKYFNVKVKNQNILLGVHAEVDALSNINPKIVKGMDILIIRCNKNLKLQNSRPCNTCIKKLQQKGIRKAYYSTSDETIVCEIVDEMPKIHESAGSRARNGNVSINTKCC